MIEKVLNRTNMRNAYHQVLSNKGSAGVDGMSVYELAAHLKQNWEQIASAACFGRYLPQPILGRAEREENVWGTFLAKSRPWEKHPKAMVRFAC